MSHRAWDKKRRPLVEALQHEQDWKLELHAWMPVAAWATGKVVKITQWNNVLLSGERNNRDAMFNFVFNPPPQPSSCWQKNNNKCKCQHVIPVQVPGALKPSLGTFSGSEGPCSPSQPVHQSGQARINRRYIFISRNKQQSDRKGWEHFFLFLMSFLSFFIFLTLCWQWICHKSQSM